MSKKVLILGTSHRRNGNSNKLAVQFQKGAEEAGNSVEMIYLADKKIDYCKGCLACNRIHKCVIDDDAKEVIEKMRNSDVIVWVTPVYYYDMSGQMKTMIDRSNPLYDSNYSFKDIYLIATAADDSSNAIDGAITGLTGWISCYPGATLKGVLKGVGLQDLNDVNDSNYLRQAYELGKQV